MKKKGTIMKNEIKLGSKVRDVASGFTGYAIAYSVQLSGTRRYGIQPYVEGGAECKDAFDVDDALLEVIDEGISDRATAPNPDIPIKCGHEVEDPVTGLKGTVTMMTLWINGCVICLVQPKGKGEKVPEAVWVDWKRLKVKSKGVAEDSKKPLKREKTGGPSANMRARRTV